MNKAIEFVDEKTSGKKTYLLAACIIVIALLHRVPLWGGVPLLDDKLYELIITVLFGSSLITLRSAVNKKA